MQFATVVVTYNRKDDLLKNIKSQLSQIRIPDEIIIVDNHGTDGTQEYLLNNRVMDSRVCYQYLDDNVGGAGGFEYGTQLAYEKEFDYIILMDDDGRPINENTFIRLIEAAEIQRKHNPMLMLNSLVKSDDTELSFSLLDTKSVMVAISYASKNLITDSISPFNGTLLTRELVSAIGFPNGSFFIKGDEADYSARAMKCGAFIATVVDSEYYHPALAMKKVNLLGKKIYITHIEKPWKEYYRSRNYTYMFCENGRHFKAFLLMVLRVFTALFMKCDRYKTIRMIKMGYNDGVKKNMGKTVSP